MSSVKVAVRVRPLDAREKGHGSACVMSVVGGTRIAVDVEKSSFPILSLHQQRAFTFDHCFDSTDRKSPNYASQEHVFKALGVEVVDNALKGYNCCLFAYGQTGAGKSYSMIGTAKERGLIPRIYQAIFETIASVKDPHSKFQVEVSFLEIYNERVKDLLTPSGETSLRVREHPATGPYVENLSKMVVTEISELDSLLARGFMSRTTAPTAINETSSRSHAIFTMVLTQTCYDHETNTLSDKVSQINLIDLAGSERVSTSGAEGLQLKEAGTINKSLFALSRVITELSEGARRVSYRDSLLTWLLKESLGGNSKTIMLANISPADINFDESLSTLRYAVRAASIVNEAVVNEDPAAVLINKLRAEIAALRAALAQSGIPMPAGGSAPAPPAPAQRAWEESKRSPRTPPAGANDSFASPPRNAAEVAEMRAWTASMRKQYDDSRSLIMGLIESRARFRLRAQMVQQSFDEDEAARVPVEIVRVSAARPHFLATTPVPAGGCLMFYVQEGATRIGSALRDTDPKCIEMDAPGVAAHHCTVLATGLHVALHNEEGVCFVNDIPADGDVALKTGDVVRFGENASYRYFESPRPPAECYAHAAASPVSHAQPSGRLLSPHHTSEGATVLQEKYRQALAELEESHARSVREMKERMGRMEEELRRRGGEEDAPGGYDLTVHVEGIGQILLPLEEKTTARDLCAAAARGGEAWSLYQVDVDGIERLLTDEAKPLALALEWERTGARFEFHCKARSRVRIHLPDGAYKDVLMSPRDTAAHVCASLRDALSMRFVRLMITTSPPGATPASLTDTLLSDHVPLEPTQTVLPALAAAQERVLAGVDPYGAKSPATPLARVRLSARYDKPGSTGLLAGMGERRPGSALAGKVGGTVPASPRPGSSTASEPEGSMPPPASRRHFGAAAAADKRTRAASATVDRRERSDSALPLVGGPRTPRRGEMERAGSLSDVTAFATPRSSLRGGAGAPATPRAVAFADERLAATPGLRRARTETA